MVLVLQWYLSLLSQTTSAEPGIWSNRERQGQHPASCSNTFIECWSQKEKKRRDSLCSRSSWFVKKDNLYSQLNSMIQETQRLWWTSTNNSASQIKMKHFSKFHTDSVLSQITHPLPSSTAFLPPLQLLEELQTEKLIWQTGRKAVSRKGMRSGVVVGHAWCC